MNKLSTKRPLLALVMLLFLAMLLPCIALPIHADGPPEAFDGTYYVSASGNDIAGDGSQDNPWATLARTADTVNADQGKNYLVVVMSDLTATACARYYDNSVTITSLEGSPFTVTRGVNFSALADVARGWYNPPMLEIESSDLSPDAPLLSLTLENIIFDDAYRHEGTIFGYAPTDFGASGTGTNFVQDSIITSYANCATIILGDGAELHSFGGMTAARAADGATLIMKAGSLVTDIGSTAATRQLSTTATDYRAVGETAVSISTGAHFYMYDGAKITNIANAHSVKLSGKYKCFIDGEIAGMKGNRGWDATDHSSSPTHEGRGFKCAVFFGGGATLDPDTGLPGSAIIGPNADIHHNAVKCGAIGISRSTSVSVQVFGKINDNIGQTGTNWQTVPIIGSMAISYGTNGGGIYIVAGGTVILEDGSEVCRNSVMNMAYGGGVNVQQSGSKLIMNGGLVKGNTASGMGPGIAVNKGGDCYFEMNGGIVDNGPDGVLLFNNRISIFGSVREDGDGNGRLILNAGIVSGVTINSLVAYGTNTANQYRNLYINEAVVIQTGYVAVAGTMQSAASTTNVPRRVSLLPANGFGGINIGNPNKALYPTINAALPKGWAMPSTADNVMAFWMKKAGTAEFSVPAPTSGIGGANYNTSLKYFIAVLETNAAGTAGSTTVKLYPTKIENGQIVVSVPLDTYANGALLALVQPSSAYGEIVFDAPASLAFVVGASTYTVPYAGEYDISLLLEELIADGHTPANTSISLLIHPDNRTVPDLSTFSISSDIFELAGAISWDSDSWELIVPIELAPGWDSPATNQITTFSFECTLESANFTDGDMLSLTGELEIAGGPTPPNYYLVNGNYALTKMVIPDGSLKIIKMLEGNNADHSEDFHFTVTFSDGNTYDGLTSGGTLTLKGGEDILVNGIPHGVTYSVVEDEANQNGYATTATGDSGTVISGTQSEAVFTNSRSSYVLTVIGSYAGSGNTGAGTYAAGVAVTVRAGIRPGFIFVGWTVNAGGVSLPSSATANFFMPANDVTVTANWLPATTGPTVVPTTPVITTSDKPTPPEVTTTATTPPVITTATNPTPTTATITPPPVITTAPEPSLPTSPTTITQTTPHTATTSSGAPTTATPPSTDDPMETWALLNLILSVLGALLALAGLVWALIRKNKEKKIRPLWLLMAAILGIAGVVVFIVTQDVSLNMAWVDVWTIVNALILVLGLISLILAFKREGDERQNARNN